MTVIEVGGQTVHGDLVDNQTRCVHYNSESDIIAIKLRCCGRWYPCSECHAASESHKTEKWPKTQFNEKAILCGACGRQLSIEEYFDSGFICPSCASLFNPGCASHYSLYFEV